MFAISAKNGLGLDILTDKIRNVIEDIKVQSDSSIKDD